MDTIISNSPLSLQTLTVSKEHRLLVLAPHPDDFDAIGVTMRFFRKNGNPLYVAVATSGARGVEDTFCPPPSLEVKIKIREQEQRDSCHFFGLPEACLTFLRLEEDKTGNLLNNEANIDRVRRCFFSQSPAMVFLPHWHDTNLTHQRVYSMLHQVVLEASYPLAIFLNRDPKTIKMRCDFYLDYDETSAAWKEKLLRLHQSQHQRNLNHRGHGMDERILNVDRHSAKVCSLNAQYAEIFEIELFGAGKADEIFGDQLESAVDNNPP